MTKLRVMISSTVADLTAERQAAEEAICHFQFDRFRSEMLGSLARSPQQVCDEMAKECDLYILIVGKRYGWVIPELGISVTEREYEVARASDDEKILVYVKELQSDRESREIQFMERVTDFRTGYFRSSEFTSPDDLKNKIQHDIGVWISDRLRKRNLSYADVAALPRPGQLISSAAYALLLILAFTIGPSFLQLFGFPSFAAPSSSKIATELWREKSKIIEVLVSSWFIVCLAYCISVITSYAFVEFLWIRPLKAKTSLQVLSRLSMIGALFVFFFGPVLFGFSSWTPSILLLALAGCGWLLSASAIEITRLYPDQVQSIVRTNHASLLAKNLLISRTLVLPLPLLFGLEALYDLASFSGSRLGRLIQDSYAVGRIELVYATIVTATISGFVVYGAARAVQSGLGWSLIIGPEVFNEMGRPK